MADSSEWEVVRGRRERAKPVQDQDIIKPEPKAKQNTAKQNISPILNKESNKESDLKNKDKNKKPQQKKTTEKKTNETKQTVEKVKLPKSLEQAITLINETELNEICESSTLLDVARFLSFKINVDQNDETYSKLPFNYPMTSVPSSLKKTIDKAIRKEAQNTSLHYCLEFCLSSIAYNMAKDLPVVGFKIMIQMIADIDTACFVKCIPKLIILMNSFQNRPPIGHTLLWAIGQGGLQNFGVGVQVWKEVMVPMIDMKHYYKYVSNYLVILLTAHVKNNKKPFTIMPFEFQELFELIHTKRKSLPKEFEKILRDQSPILRELYFDKTESWKKFNFMDKFFSEIPDAYYKKNQKYDYKVEEILKSIIQALSKNHANYNTLKTLQTKYVKGSTHVIGFIERDWKTLGRNLDRKNLQEFISHSESFYQNLYIKNKGVNEINEIVQSCRNISNKMTSSAKSESKGFPWLLGCMVLALAVGAALVAYDFTVNGTFEKSHTKVAVLRSIDHAQYAATKGLTFSARGFKWAEKNLPDYFTTVVEFSKPYVEVGRDMTKITINGAVQAYANAKEYVVDTWPKVYSTIDFYAPGYLDIIWNYITIAWNAMVEFISKYYNIILTYLKTEVFIDNWAPQILQEKTLKAFNATQIYAVEYYKWFYKHVDDYSKL